MDIFYKITENLPIFFLIFGRVGGIFFAAPAFSSRNVPPQVKIALSGFVSLIVFLVKKHPEFPVPEHLLGYVLSFAGELAIGLIIGFAMQFIFAAIQLGGNIIDMQMGFAIVNIIDPLSGTAVPLIGNFKYILAMLLFLATNSHYFVFYALFQSFDLVPLTGLTMSGPFYEKMIMISMSMFVTAVKLALPVVGAIFIVEMAMGIIARTVPQVNIFIVGIPAKIIVGIAILMVVLPFYIIFLNRLFDNNFRDVIDLLRLLGR